MIIQKIREYRHLNIIQFIYYNYLCKNVVRDPHCMILPYGRTRIRISGTAEIHLHGNLSLNVRDQSAFSHRCETSLSVLENGRLEILNNCRMCRNVDIRVKRNGQLVLNQSYINQDSRIICGKEIVLGHESGCSYGCYISDITEHAGNVTNSLLEYAGAPIHIGDNVWIGAYSTVRYGVTIGDNAVIGAGSYISEDIPAGTATLPIPSRPFFRMKSSLETNHMEDRRQAPFHHETDIPEDIVQKLCDGLRKQLGAEVDWLHLEGLLDNGVIDSLRMASITAMIEEEFNLQIPWQELVSENYNSVHAMAGMICRLQAVGPRINSFPDTPAGCVTQQPVDIPSGGEDSAENAFTGQTPAGLFLLNVRKNQDKAALVTKNGSTTFGELYKSVSDFCGAFAGLSIGKGDRVILQSSRMVEFVTAYLSLQLLTAIPVPVEADASTDRLQELAELVNGKLIVSERKSPGSWSITWDSLIKAAENSVNVTLSEEKLCPEDVCQILYTTGTTGLSKGVMRTNRAVTFDMENLVRYIHPDSGALLSAFPLNHDMGIKCSAALTAMTAVTVIYADGFRDIGWILRKLREYNVTTLVVPSFGLRLLLPSLRSDPGALSGVKRICYAGSKLSDEVLEEMSRLCDAELIDCYGSTEIGIVRLRYAGRDTYPSRNVYPDGVEVRLMAEDGTLSGNVGAEGRVCVCSPSLMKGYCGDLALTEKVMHGEWLIMSDLGYFDENGGLCLRGRADDVINLSGLKLNPEEMEAVLLQERLVADCVCFLAEDHFGYPYLKLLAVPVEEEINPDKIRACLLRHFEPRLIPHFIDPVVSIRKTCNGKTDRKYYARPAGFSPCEGTPDTAM